MPRKMEKGARTGMMRNDGSIYKQIRKEWKRSGKISCVKLIKGKVS